ncbi:(4Fe-4S)-binding protein [Catenuloplanes atrovinosus]|uniref:Fe-S cluster protein YjdI n=1 Tax=Catenuloplanes atrovinosus TaxID=137266 RepID=A0AAE3YMB0_9ACTN|nr:(4Fe-4S)-binding protein [Catenuloplanes atrovinosus]MDR7275662.1 putative Fe-S cluster protein YjdI [Catenuloplanes atrovinosus]
MSEPRDIEIVTDDGPAVEAPHCLPLPALARQHQRAGSGMWIAPDNADAVAEVVTRCPSGALRYTRPA